MISRQTGGDARVTVSAPHMLDVSSEADHTEARAVQVGMYASFVYQEELTLDEGEILAPAVERLKEL
ncbi:MAG TPA: hypothetical protein VFI46_18455 [Jiangellaceae bacterium]|nr:hypothetical protein [Jiangellaceae bacterium]